MNNLKTLITMVIFFITSGLTTAFLYSYKANTKSRNTTVADESFEISIVGTFYMTADNPNDLYVTALVKKGIIKPNIKVDIVKNEDPNKRVSANLYKLCSIDYKPINSAKTGEEVIIYLKINNDKNFIFSNNGKEYTLVNPGASLTAAASKPIAGKVTITLDGKPWKYDYFKVRHYTKDFGVTKNKSMYLFTFTKKNNRLKTAPEEVLNITLFDAPQKIKNFSKQEIDISFISDLFGEERNYGKAIGKDLPASAVINQYSQKGLMSIISGKITSDIAPFACKDCKPNIVKISVDFENIEAEIYDK